MTSALLPTYARYGLSFVRGEGVYLWDKQERRYLDFTSGIGVNNLGHVHPHVKEALQSQLERLWHTSNLFQQPLQQEVAQRLCRASGLDLAFFCNSGAEANEAAIKLARRYAQLVLGKEAGEIITFNQSFHGRTLATLTATGQEKVKEGFAPLPAGFVHVPYNDLALLKASIGDNTCGVLLEVVQGEGGVYPASLEWYLGVRRLCDERGLLLLVDEIQTGMGRTGAWFGFQNFPDGAAPDVISLAKGLGSGFPVGAVLAKRKLGEAFPPGSHGSTFGGNPLAMTAALATLEVMAEEEIPLQARHNGEFLRERLQQYIGADSRVVEIRGQGMMLGIELRQEVAPLIQNLQAEGLLVLSAGPRVIRLLPPLVASRDELDQGVELLAAGLAGWRA